VGRTGFEPVKV